MDFLQHFLIGKPLEHNAQTSYMVSGTAAFPAGKFTTRVALDAETASSELTEFQPGPATDGAPPANAIRPAGLHYDYTVDSWTLGATLALEYRILENLTVTAALRADQTNYDYDNHMIDGNTRPDGAPCGAGGCLFSRPADRSDQFDNVSPSVTLAWQPSVDHLLYVNASDGFRPPEMTELYRLQRQQSVADLDSESLDSVELGWKLHVANFSLNTALFAMKKSDLILRETNGFNVSNGATRHRGFEYEATLDASRWALSRQWHRRPPRIRFLARHRGRRNHRRWQRHRYGPAKRAFAEPRTRAGLVERSDEWHLVLEGTHVGHYFLDAANTATYPGTTSRICGWRGIRPARCVRDLRVDNLFDKRYADRADFAFGNYRYFPARGRAVFLSVDYASY